ncbi:hypothetical protein AGR4A_Lc10114 [Agrobacterium tumefaciens str. B6]|uniref:Uncharacterized protein n=1 Tax=Agrobacterium tumefaciens str. B6 TaxID=1183423 RepID=A0A822V0A4_AGRTU|nr:hypothetical protein AGR4A_Lc10114 [Agrobacterium tumefaciens str. B6]
MLSRTTVIFPSSTSGRHVKALPHPSQFKAKQKCIPALRGATQAPACMAACPGRAATICIGWPLHQVPCCMVITGE